MRSTGRSPGRSDYVFSSVASANIPRSVFNRSHGCKTTFDAGELIPVYVDEALPGDTFNMRMTAFGRLATPIFPIMDNLYLDTFFFACPMRLVWSNFQKMMGEQDNPADSTDFTVPTMPGVATTGYTQYSLSDYLGIPTGVPDLQHSSLWHRMYNLCYNQWFRDENLVDSVVVDLDDGPDNPADYVLLNRGKRHDYFTSCLPWPQKVNDGSTLNVPLGGTAALSITGQPIFAPSTGTPGLFKLGSNAGTATVVGDSGNFSATNTFNWFDPGLEVDLSTASGVTINELREAFQIQKLFERDARGGTRYTEIIKSHFGVTSPDARLQRIEYLGGGSVPVNISPVAQTSATAGANALGDLAGFGTVTSVGHGFSKSFTEHTLLLGLVCLRADLNYQQGLNRMFSRSTRYDFYWPALAHIGEQAVLNKEIYAQGSANAVADAATFGYQERFAEYRYKPSIVTGLFRSNAAGTLDAWHLAQDFSALPVLNASFITEDPPVDRVIAVNTEPHMILDTFFSLKCARPMPVYATPGLIDHF